MSITWDDRHQVTTPQEAVEALADFFSSHAGISRVLDGGPSDDRRDSDRMASVFDAASSGNPDHLMQVVNRMRDQMEEAEALAKKWSIPFNRDLMEAMIRKLDQKHDNAEGYWYSSSMAC